MSLQSFKIFSFNLSCRSPKLEFLTSVGEERNWRSVDLTDAKELGNLSHLFRFPFCYSFSEIKFKIQVASTIISGMAIHSSYVW